MISSMEQSARDKAAYQEKKKASMLQEKRAAKFRVFRRLVYVIIACSLLFVIIQHDNKIAAQEFAAAQKKYAKWASYRDTHCKVVENIYGLTIVSGKFSSKDNAVGYSCDDGVKYIISQNEEARFKEGRGDGNFIPNVK